MMDLQKRTPKPANGYEKSQETIETETNVPNTDDQYEPETCVNEKFIQKEEEACKVEFDVEKPKPLLYTVSENPPLHLSFLFGLQQAMLTLASPIAVTLIVCEVACCQDDQELKLKLLSTTIFMAGLATLSMTTFGVRLPIFQGPTPNYLIALVAMQSLDEWRCPATYKTVDPMTNKTVVMAVMSNATDIPNRELSLGIISQLSGSLMVAGGIHFLIGATGLVGFFMRYIGPITIVPTIVLVGLQAYIVVVKFCESDWSVAAVVAALTLIFSLYLGKYDTPIPMWSRRRGFHIKWYPFHNMCCILLGMSIGWILAAILTSANYYTDDPDNKHFLARTDARTYLITETNWLLFPYPGQFGSSYVFNTGVFVNFMVATFMSLLDSIGDYAACARISRVAPPPPYAFNRGLAIEGLMSTLSGAMGSCHATVSHGGNIGAIGVSKVASRRVFQMLGVIYIAFAVFGKLGAAFITIPYSVLGGLLIVTIGIFLGMLFSYLQAIDLNSTRNLAIIGITLLLGFSIPHYIKKSPGDIDTGNSDLDSIIRMILSNPAFIGGFFSCFLDNTVPGTLKERGLLAQMKDLDDEDAKKLAKSYEDGQEVYRLPHIPDFFRKSRFARIFPLFDLKVD